MGRSIKNLLNLQPTEKIAATLRIDGDPGGDKDKTFVPHFHIVFATRDGTVKKTNLAEFRNIRRDGIIAIKIEEGNDLIDVKLTSGEDEIVFVTNRGLSLRCNEGQVRDMGRNSRGVMGIRPGKGDYVVALAVVVPDAQLLVVSENGIGKQTPLEDYRVQSRGGKGIITKAIGQVLDHAFNTLGLHRVMAEVETENPASARVLLKNGFRHEGTLRECEWKEGRWVSLDVYAKLAPVQP